MKVDLEEVFKAIDEEREYWNAANLSNNKRKLALKVLKGVDLRLRYNFPEYVVCFGNVIKQFGGALAVLSNDSSTLRDVRVLRLKPQQAREKLENGDIVFTEDDLKAYGKMLDNARDIAMINRAVMSKEDFIEQYLTEEATEDDE